MLIGRSSYVIPWHYFSVDKYITISKIQNENQKRENLNQLKYWLSNDVLLL